MKIRRDFDSKVTSQYCKVTGSIVACGRTVRSSRHFFCEGSAWLVRCVQADTTLSSPSYKIFLIIVYYFMQIGERFFVKEIYLLPSPYHIPYHILEKMNLTTHTLI